MRNFAEFLAGCPRTETHNEEMITSQSDRSFPGLMMTRMYILLTRPKEAIGEFGDGDYKTPFLFFLFFTIILSCLESLASLLQSTVFILHGLQAIHGPENQPGISEALGLVFSNDLSSFVLGIFERIIESSLGLVLSVIILALVLWFITGVRTWNPAFTISAYSLPVGSLLITILAVIQIPQSFPYFLSLGLAYAFVIAGILLTIVIAGYGIIALAKIPVITGVIVIIIWLVIRMAVLWLTNHYVIISIEEGLLGLISQTYFPQSFATASALGKIP